MNNTDLSPECKQLLPEEWLSLLFSGYEKANYTFKRTGTENGKVVGTSVCIHKPLDTEAWRGHLSGGPGLSIIPLREDNTVLWGCLDIDDRSIDLAAFEQKIKMAELPLVVCRSKSGGAHAYLFLEEPAPAADVLDLLGEWAVRLGHRSCEVFPKQTVRLKAEDVGSGVNMPYAGGDETDRYAIRDGKRLTLAEFLDFAEARRVSLSDLASAADGDAPTSALFPDGPPCLEHLAANEGFPEGTRNEGMYNVGVYLKKYEQHSQQYMNIEEEMNKYNQALCDPPLKTNEIRALVKSLERKDYEYKCKQSPIKDHCKKAACKKQFCGVGGGKPISEHGIAATLTDVGNGERLVARHGADLRYCHKFKSWFIWDGKRWLQDDAGKITDLCMDTAKQIFDEAKAGKTRAEQEKISSFSMTSQNRAKLEAMAWAAQSALHVRPDDFDADPDYLGVLNGTVNLSTGERLPPDRADLISKLAGAAHDPELRDEDCPLWMAFLDRIMSGNQALIAFLQRAVGYSLTGDIGEQCFFLLHGSGANGKSTFIEVLQALLGEYAQPTEFRTLLHRDSSDAVRNDLAMLKGARLVSAVEVGRGKRFDESLIKTLTGGDTISARFLHQEYFDFRPQFKLWLAANDRPEIRGQDHAIWRRVMLVPFAVTIPSAEQDKTLLAKLRRELPAIMAWAVRGCLEWRRDGLQPPNEVTGATEQYRLDSDILGDFIAAFCVQDPKASESIARLHMAHQQWAMNEGRLAKFDSRIFGKMLTERGFCDSRIISENGEKVRKRFGLALNENGSKLLSQLCSAQNSDPF